MSRYRIVDENPFAEDAASLYMMRKAFPTSEADSFSEAQDEAYRRSFINTCIVSAIYRDGEFLGRCLDGHWAPAGDFA